MRHLFSYKALTANVLRYLFILLLLAPVLSCEKDEVTTDEIAQEESDEESNTDNEEPEDDPEDESSGDGSEEGTTGDDTTGSGDTGSDCPDTIGFIFEESNGLVSIEFENNEFPEGWVLKNDASDTSGEGYMQWEGNSFFNAPGNGMVVFPIRITTTGTYRFIWKSSFRLGTNGTEHNDSWLRFPDAADFFGRKSSGSIVYPQGTGKQPNPNGSSSDGWFKIYRSGNDNAFTWQSSTSDNDGHDIFVTFAEAGVYLLEVSARSNFHGIDRIVMFEESLNPIDAINAADVFSVKTSCD